MNGIKRWFTVHIPPGYQPGIPMPLVINIHAYSSTAFEQEALSQMHAKADKSGFIVVNPQALDNPPSWRGMIPGPNGQVDKDFFKEMLAYLQREISIDPARIYATGMSDGAAMTHRLGCVMSDTFAAIAPVSGAHVVYDQCEIDHPVSVLVIHGTQDTVITNNGDGSDSVSVQGWMEAWAERNGCDLTPAVDHPYSEVTRETWGDCDQDVVVTFYTLEGGGHTWPGAPLSATSGSSFPYMNATDVILDFFKSHPRHK